jgi:hypothetical protein
MNTAKVIGGIAKAVIATMAGGPIAGGAAAANEATDVLIDWLGREHTPSLQSTIAEVRVGLEELARSERISEEQVMQGVDGAQLIILRHGLTAAEIVGHDLDAGRVTATILSRSTAELNELDEAGLELCRRAIGVAYATVLANSKVLPELQRAFQQAVLNRLTELRDQPRQVLLALRGALTAAAVVDQRRQWRADLYPPSALLRPDFEIVPFYGREDVLADLRHWTASTEPLGIRVITGAGGMGKTRLLIEVCGQLSREGWRAGFLNIEAFSREWQVPTDGLFQDGRPSLIAIDYAETRIPEVVTLLRAARDRGQATPVRIVLLARALGDWWVSLETKGGGVGEIMSGPATQIVPMRPIASDAARRASIFEHAASAFQRLMPCGVKAEVPSLEASHYDRVLYILIAALAAVQGEAVNKEDDLLDWALRREREFLDEGISAAGHGHLQGRPILQCAAVATLAGHARDRGGAIRLLSTGAPLLSGQPAVVVDAVAELLHRLYPGESWLQGVLPDLLGEHLVERAMDEDDELLSALFHRG